MDIDRKAFRSLSSGLYVISAHAEDDRNCACIVNTLLQVASEPAQLLVSINKENATASAVSNGMRFCASALSQEATMDLIGTFGFQTSYDIDKFAEIEHDFSESGSPFLTECTLTTFDVRVDTVLDVGTHYVFVGTVEDARVLAQGEPLTYSYYHTVLRGKTPQKAASYNDGDDSKGSSAKPPQDAEEGKVAWRCKICGHVVEGYPDGLPEDFVCPICKMACSCFERITL